MFLSKIQHVVFLIFVVVVFGCTEKQPNNTKSNDTRLNTKNNITNSKILKTEKLQITTIQNNAIIKKKQDLKNVNNKAKSYVPDGMLLVLGGSFLMGANDIGERDERPEHKVYVNSFYLDITEVTNKAYFKCVDAGVCRKHTKASAKKNKFGNDNKFRTPNRPISSISQNDAAVYCNWIGKRLATEVEFERASRGDDGRRYPWGNESPTPDKAVYSTDLTQPVGSKPNGAGPYGHLDLTGNVWEWTSDRYDPLAYRRLSKTGKPASCKQIILTQNMLRKTGKQGYTGTNPIPTKCEYVLRGGAFNYPPHGLRSSNRVHHPGSYRLIMSGFRCAKDLLN